MKELIIIKQLPIIEEQLKSISDEIDKKLEGINELVCNEDTVKSVKTTRAEFNKEFKDFEEKRKEVKTKVLAPYEQFEQVYKQYIAEEKATKQDKETTERKRQDSNYSICIKVENDLVDFFKNALWITRKSKKDYLNDLIRQDFIKTIGARKNATDDELKELWENYKKENNL